MGSNIRWRGLRIKIVAWSFVPTVIILMAVALVTFAAYRQVTEILMVERIQERIHFSAGHLATEMTEYTNLLSDLERIADTSHSDPKIQQAVLQQNRNRLMVFDGGVLILNTFGVVVAAEPERPDILGENWLTRRYFRQMIHSQSPVFSNILSDGPDGGEVVAIALPINGQQGEFRGVLAGMFRLGTPAVSALYGNIVKLRIGETGNTYLVDDDGRVIYHSNSKHIGQDFSMQTVVEQALGGNADSIRTRDSKGTDIVAVFAAIPGTPWQLIKEEGWAVLTSGYRGYQRFLIALLVLGVVIPALVVAVGVRQIIKPVTELITAAQQVARGNFTQTINVGTGDEIEELAEQFNLMSAQLQESYARLEQRLIEQMQIKEALRESEEKYRRIFESIEEGYLLADLDGKVLAANPSAARMLKYDRASELLAKNIEQDLYEDATDRTALKEILTQQGGVNGFQIRFKQNDGQIIMTDCNIHLLFDNHNTPVAIEGTFRDITERIEMERKVREAERLADIGKLTTSLSHEIRNPLSATKMNLQILSKSGQLLDEDRPHLEIALAEVIRLEGMLSELLDFARPLFLKKRSCQLNTILTANLNLLAVKFEQKQVSVISSFDGEIPEIEADEGKLSRAFINLLLNALEVSEDGGKIWVTSRYLTETDPPGVEVLIEDEGPGISQEHMFDIFTPFFTTKSKGTGLGLTNVKQTIEAHEGRVEASNRPSSGAAFRVWLPVEEGGIME